MRGLHWWGLASVPLSFSFLGLLLPPMGLRGTMEKGANISYIWVLCFFLAWPCPLWQASNDNALISAGSPLATQLRPGSLPLCLPGPEEVHLKGGRETTALLLLSSVSHLPTINSLAGRGTEVE